MPARPQRQALTALFVLMPMTAFGQAVGPVAACNTLVATPLVVKVNRLFRF